MPHSPTTLSEKLNELQEHMEREKVVLSPDVQRYLEEHITALEKKVQNEENLTEQDLEFIEKVKMWVEMPEGWRKELDSIEKMDISQQWKGVLHIADVAGKDMKWISETFTLSHGKIKTKGDLDLQNTKIQRLPEGLEVGGHLDLRGCTSLKSLPEGLGMGGYLDLNGCANLTSLPKGLKVGGDLVLSRCIGLRSLPEGLKVGSNLGLNKCTNLTSLPEGLKCEILYLSKDLHPQVKADAEKLQELGQIQEIRYL